ncbi:nipped-B-like protein B [Venturia canescens]|uniref:nipped-B-like protein B n=1 Tax=Venturia canescens TaxID=32260 RepID=UPI001C9D0812|nr:nipped-B-like protein B [Venturia canescens]XP_043282980.1 nipped-B-like protein B [Venturia canescens]
MPEQIKFKMNGVIPSVPITTLAGIASLTDLLPEMPLPTPLPQTLTNKSLLFHPRVAEEAQILLSVRDENLVPQLITSLSQTSSDHIELKDHYANVDQPLESEQNTPELLKAILQINPDVFKGPQYSSPRNWSSQQGGTPLIHANQSPANYGRFSPSYSSSSGSRQTPQGSPAHPAAARTVLPPPSSQQSGISHPQHLRMPVTPQNHADLSQMSPFAVPSPSPRATVITEQTRTSTTPQHMQDDVNCISQTLTGMNTQTNMYSPAHMGSPSTPVMPIGNVTPQHHGIAATITPQQTMLVTSPMHSGMSIQQSPMQQNPPIQQHHQQPQQIQHHHHQQQQQQQQPQQQQQQQQQQHLLQQHQSQPSINQIQPNIYEPMMNQQLHHPLVNNDQSMEIDNVVAHNQQFLLDPSGGLSEIDLPIVDMAAKQMPMPMVPGNLMNPVIQQQPPLSAYGNLSAEDMLGNMGAGAMPIDAMNQHYQHQQQQQQQQQQQNNNAAREIKLSSIGPQNESKLKEPVVMLKRLSLADQALMQKSLSAFAEKSPTRAAKMGLMNTSKSDSESDEEVGENNKYFKARAKERQVQREKDRAERKNKNEEKTRRRRRMIDDEDDEDDQTNDEGKKESSLSPVKPKIRKIEKKLVPVLAKLSVDELMETNTYQRFNTTIETIFDNTEDAGNFGEIDEDGDVPAEMLIPKYQLQDLCTEAAKLKALGAMESIPSDRLVRLLNILEKNIRDGARVSPLADPDDDVDESRLWMQLAMERVQRAVDASLIALNIMTSQNMPKTVYLEDVIDRVVLFMKFQLQNTIYPSFDPVYRIDSKNKTENYNSSGRKKRGHMKEVREKSILQVYNKMRELVALLAELLNIQVLTDTIVLHASTLGVAPFFVEGVSDLQLSALKLVTVIFTKYEKHRRLLLDDILTSIARLPSSKRSLRTYRLSSEDHIQMLTALVLQLIQCVVTLPENIGRNDKTSRSATGDEDKKPEDKKSMAMDGDVFIINKYETATRIAANFLNVFLSKCGSKGEDIDYRPLFENFVQDLLATVNKPEWPAAELLLSLLGTLLVGHFSNKSSDMSLRVASIDYLGVVAARLRKDAVNSQCKLSTIDQIIRDIKAEQQKDTDYEHLKDPEISGLSEDEERTMFLQRVLLDYLAVNGTKDTALGYARHFYLAQWYRDCAVEKTRVGQAKIATTPSKKQHKKRPVKKKNSRHMESDQESESDVEEIDPDENDNNEQKNSEAYRIIEEKKKFILKRIRPSSSATKPDVLQTYIDYNSAELISQYLASTRPFSQSFDKYLKQILHVLTESSIAIRTKAMKCLTMIVEADSSVLARFDMQMGVKHSFLDHSTSVREAAVDLVGKFVLSRPELIDKYYDMLSARILDTGVSVRKRVIKILKDICMECPDFPKIPEICVKMIRRVNDEEGIRKLVMEVFQNMWFTPVRERPSIDSSALLRKVMNITDVVAASKDMGLEWFEQLLVSLFKPKEDKDDSTKMLTEPPKALLTACKQIVDCLIENVLRLDETNLEDEGKSEKKGSSQRLVACLTTLHLFAKIRPQLLVNHAITLQPYLSLKCQTQGDYQIISSVAHTLELVVPLMEHPSETFLAQLEEDSIKLILQHDRSVVASCLSCLGSIVNNVTRNFKLIRDCFNKYNGHLDKYKSLYENDPTNPNLTKYRPFFRRALFTVGLLLRHFNFTDPEVIEGLDPNIKDKVFETLSYFLNQDNDDIRQYTLSAIGSLCIRHYEFMMQPELKELYHYLLTSDHALVHMRIQVLNNIEIYLQEEEKRMIKQDLEWAKLSKQENLKEMGDVSSGMASTVIQLYLKEILESFIHSTVAVRHAALKVIQLILAQGLVHPVQIVPYLVCMSTDCEKIVSHSADKQLQDIEKKYPGFIHMKSQFGIKLSYRLQKILQHEVAVRGMRIKEGEFPGALNGFLYTILRNTKQQRRAIVLSFLKQFDESAKTSLSQMLYLADNLAYFTYQVQDEPLFIIHHIDIIISVSGTNLLQSFKEALLPKEGSGPVTNADNQHTSNMIIDQPPVENQTNNPIAVPQLYAPDGQSRPIPLSSLDDEEDDEEDDETILARLPSSTTLLRQYLTASQGFMLLLTLRQHLKDLYGFSDAKISQYSPSEAAKVYEKAVNRKNNLLFKPKATLQKLHEDIDIGLELDDVGRRKLVKDYLDFKQLMLKFDPEEPDEDAVAAAAAATAAATAAPSDPDLNKQTTSDLNPRIPNPEIVKLPDNNMVSPQQYPQSHNVNSSIEHPNHSVNMLSTNITSPSNPVMQMTSTMPGTPRVPKLTIHTNPDSHRKHRSTHKTEKTKKHKKKKRRRISDSSDSGDDCSDPDFMV